MKTYNKLVGYGLAISGVAAALASFAPQLLSASSIFLSSSMDVGSSGADVTSLQQFLSGDRHIYPRGIVSGYYGPLTQNAVKQFQIAYSIDPVGRVGPVTLGQINSIGTRGLGLDVTAPVASNFSVSSIERTNAVLSWSTNEPTQGKVYYSTNPLTAQEATSNFTQPVISGQSVADITFNTAHNIVLPNLSPSTLYYFMTVSTDESGNMTVGQQGTVTTGS